MLFNSWEFLVLLLVTFVVYYVPWLRGRHGKAWQVTVALVASVVFYGWEDPRLLLLLAVSCVGNSVATGRIIQHKLAGDEGRVKRWVRMAVALNLGLLGVFKYAPFIAGMLPFLPVQWVQALRSIPLPIGISFYTFHGISMIVDVARGEVTRESDVLMSGESGAVEAAVEETRGDGAAAHGGLRAFLSHGQRFAKGVRDIGFYLLFFPQLVAGPIVKAKQFWPQIAAKRFGDIAWGTVWRSLIAGYFLKMVVADNLSEQTVTLTKPWMAQLSPPDLMALLYGYSLQIFADFAGYSLIAIGLAAMFGYRFPMNFNFPYLSTSVTEFWRRWHMSLSGWLRDYLYIPLGGNRKGERRTYLNLFMVMFLGGLWHGAEWKFALWGSLHGLLLAVERLVWRRRDRQGPRPGWLACAGWCYAFHAVTFLWLTFLMPDMRQIGLFFHQLAIPGKAHGPAVFVPAVFGTAVVIYHAAGWVREHAPPWATRFRGSLAEGLVYGGMLFLLLTNAGSPQGFIYFQF
ncbi:MBOAT family O-acyltransferase [Luteolibacter sp. LG18]|uniref:MBOAT family O-acyltransferase n=1 Tax=Luteolibacter sp. LG18 TaxID=2819286 RepID=UPI002B2EBF7C|nr:alginate O-acetyltransferase [Luteolibacter sp. LG18]